LISTVKGSHSEVIKVRKSRNIEIRFLNIVEGAKEGWKSRIPSTAS